jgi:osmotically-inducible protein OsmY
MDIKSSHWTSFAARLSGDAGALGGKVKALSTAMLAAWVCATTHQSAWANEAATRSPETVIVTAKKQPEPVPDEVVVERVQMALHSDRYFYDGHVTVTVKNGVAYLQGIVFDESDLRLARLISRRVAGVKRVVNQLEICTCDGG